MDETVPVVEVAEECFHALARAHWRGAVELMCPRTVEDAAERWRSQMRTTPSKAMDVEAYRALDPEMPDAVAKYWAKQAERAGQECASWWKHEFPGIASEEEVLQAPAEELMVRYVSTFERMNMGEPVFESSIASDEGDAAVCQTSTATSPLPNRALRQVPGHGVAMTTILEP